MLQLNLFKNIKEKPFDECYARAECKEVKNRIQYHHCNQTKHSLLPTLDFANKKNIVVVNSLTRCVRRSVLCRFSFRCWCHDTCRDMQRKRKEEMKRDSIRHVIDAEIALSISPLSCPEQWVSLHNTSDPFCLTFDQKQWSVNERSQGSKNRCRWES